MLKRRLERLELVAAKPAYDWWEERCRDVAAARSTQLALHERMTVAVLTEAEADELHAVTKDIEGYAADLAL